MVAGVERARLDAERERVDGVALPREPAVERLRERRRRRAAWGARSARCRRRGVAQEAQIDVDDPAGQVDEADAVAHERSDRRFFFFFSVHLLRSVICFTEVRQRDRSSCEALPLFYCLATPASSL